MFQTIHCTFTVQSFIILPQRLTPNFNLFSFQLFTWKVVSYIPCLLSAGQSHPVLDCVSLLIAFLRSHLGPSALQCPCFRTAEFRPRVLSHAVLVYVWVVFTEGETKTKLRECQYSGKTNQSLKPYCRSKLKLPRMEMPVVLLALRCWDSFVVYLTGFEDFAICIWKKLRFFRLLPEYMWICTLFCWTWALSRELTLLLYLFKYIHTTFITSVKNASPKPFVS